MSSNPVSDEQKLESLKEKISLYKKNSSNNRNNNNSVGYDIRICITDDKLNLVFNNLIPNNNSNHKTDLSIKIVCALALDNEMYRRILNSNCLNKLMNILIHSNVCQEIYSTLAIFIILLQNSKNKVFENYLINKNKKLQNFSDMISVPKIVGVIANILFKQKSSQNQKYFNIYNNCTVLLTLLIEFDSLVIMFFILS